MSSAKKDMEESALCSHISISGFVLFHRAKPVTETACPALPGMKRSGIEVHGGLPGGPTESNHMADYRNTSQNRGTANQQKAGGISPYIHLTCLFCAKKWRK